MKAKLATLLMLMVTFSVHAEPPTTAKTETENIYPVSIGNGQFACVNQRMSGMTTQLATNFLQSSKIK